MLIGGRGKNKLVGGEREYGYRAINDPSSTNASGYPTGEDAVTVLNKDLGFADLGLPATNSITSMVKATETDPVPLFPDSNGNDFAGNDTLIGTAGNDVLIGGPDNNKIDGLTGTDRLYGEAKLYIGKFNRSESTAFAVDAGPSGTSGTLVYGDHTQDSLLVTHDTFSDGLPGQSFIGTNPDTGTTVTLTAGNVYTPPTPGTTGGINTGGNLFKGIGGPPPTFRELLVVDANDNLLVHARGIQTVSVVEDPTSQDTMHVNVDMAGLAQTEVTNVKIVLSHDEDASPETQRTHTNTVSVWGNPMAATR